MVRVSRWAGSPRARFTSERGAAATPRIAFYSPGWPPGDFPNGIVTYVANLRAPLAEVGFASRILAASVGPSSADSEVVDARTLRRLRPLPIKALDAALYRLAPERTAALRMGHELTAAFAWLRRTFPFDLIEMEESFGVAEGVRRRLEVPVVVRLHGPWFLNGTAVGALEDGTFERRVAGEGLAIARAVAVTAPSHDVLEQVRRRYRLSLPEAEVIPYPGPVVPADQRWDVAVCERDAILFVGRFDRHKGGDLAIDAFRELAREFPALGLWFVGPDRGFVDDGGRWFDLPAYLEDHLADGGVRGRVRVLGPQSHQAISRLRRRAFLTIVPSRYDNFPMTVLEALAFGSPLVVSAAGGIPEMVRDGETGLWFRAGDFRDLAAKVRQLLVEPSLAPALAARARADFEARFSPAAVARRTADHYQKVLAAAETTRRRGGANRLWRRAG